MKKIKAFTLAEVLITLTILGVVAAIAMPNLIRNYKNKVAVTKLAKAYATIENAAQNIKASTGCENVACLQKLGWNEIGKQDSGHYYSAQFQNEFAKAAGFPPQALKITDNDGWTCAKNLYCEKMECDNTCPTSVDMSHFYGTILIKDGIWYHASYEDSYLFVTVGTEYKKDKRYVAGRNYFNFAIYDNFNVVPSITGYGARTYPAVNGKVKLHKSGTLNDNIYEFCDPDKKYTLNGSRYSGNSCAARIILDGWKMKY